MSTAPALMKCPGRVVATDYGIKDSLDDEINK